MAYSYINYTSDGSQVNYSVPYAYLEKPHVIVYVEGIEKTVDVHYSWLNDSVIQFDTAPALGDIISIKRSSGHDARLVDFQTSSLLDEATLDLNSNQLFYLMQEAFDALVLASGEDSAIFTTPQAILDAFVGSLSLTQLDPTLASAVGYLNTNYLNDAIYEFDEDGTVVYEDEVYHHGYTKLVWIDGNLIVTGSILSDSIAANQIIGSHILAGEIDTDHLTADCITANEIDALAIEAQHIQVDAIEAGHIKADAVEADAIKAGEIVASHIKGNAFGELTITSGSIIINVAEGLEILAGEGILITGGADMTLSGSDTDPGKLIFKGSSHTVQIGGDADGDRFTITPDTTEVVNLFIGNADWWSQDKTFKNVSISAYQDLLLSAKYSSNNYTALLLDSTSGNQTIILDVSYGGDQDPIYFRKGLSDLYFAPLNNGTIDLGQASQRWQDFFTERSFQNHINIYETSTPDNIDSVGQFWTQSNNDLYFRAGNGVIYQVQLIEV